MVRATRPGWFVIGVLLLGCSQTVPYDGEIEQRLAPEYQIFEPDSGFCNCLDSYEATYETTGDVSSIGEGVEACFSLDDPVALQSEGLCLPRLFTSPTEGEPDIEVVHLCLYKCSSTGFIIARYAGVDDRDACLSIRDGIWFTSEDGDAFGCIPGGLQQLIPVAG